MPRILVVADEPWVRNAVHAALSDSRIELRDLQDPESASEIVAEGDIDAVVADLQVGSMGGMALTRAVKDVSREDSSVPVILLLDRSADTFLAGRSGADAWVTKPFSAADLRDALNAAIVPGRS
jgi:DNA-binding response OmpR family regulator